MKLNKLIVPSMDIQISSNFERQLFESTNRNSDIIQKIMKTFIQKGNQQLTKDIIKDLQSIYITHSVSNLETLETIKNF